VSVAVELADLAEKIETFGPVAYLVTVGADAMPHSVSVAVSWNGDALTAGAGRRTAANAQEHPAVTLLWAARPGEPYCLIVDGTAETAPAETDVSLRIHPTRAVLHRVALADPGLASCITVLDR
jgi:hypothetical protein